MSDSLSWKNQGLVDGLIPAGCECPFKQRCSLNENQCHHKGTDHKVDFSCAMARAFALSEANT